MREGFYVGWSAPGSMRWRKLPAWVATMLILVLVVPGAGAAEVELVSVEHPDPVVFDHVYPVNATLRNTGSEPVEVSLYTLLYEPDGSPCGSASGSDFHGAISLFRASAEVPPGATVMVPGEDGTPWSHRVNASNHVDQGGTYEVCTFAEDSEGTTADERYLDHEVQRVTLRMTNEAPTGSFTVTPEEGTTETVFRFEATGEDPEGDPVMFRWDLNDHTASGWARAVGAETTHRFYPAGVFTVNLTLSDGWDERVIQKDVVVRPAGEGGPGRLLDVPGSGPAVLMVAGALAAVALTRRRR